MKWLNLEIVLNLCKNGSLKEAKAIPNTSVGVDRGILLNLASLRLPFCIILKSFQNEAILKCPVLLRHFVYGSWTPHIRMAVMYLILGVVVTKSIDQHLN